MSLQFFVINSNLLIFFYIPRFKEPCVDTIVRVVFVLVLFMYIYIRDLLIMDVSRTYFISASACSVSRSLGEKRMQSPIVCPCWRLKARVTPFSWHSGLAAAWDSKDPPGHCNPPFTLCERSLDFELSQDVGFNVPIIASVKWHLRVAN